MTAYYNENDPKAAAWLRELIKQGHIAPGDVDDRSISDVKPAELAGYTQHHFFAGIGVWSYAIRKAGWPDQTPVWTGSCPCQPFSNAGKGAGTADERHLWPHWFWLIEQCRPATIFGEQVASKAGRAWFDTVSADLEALGFAVGGADLCAAGVGAPHIRQRLWFVAQGLADAECQQRERRGPSEAGDERGSQQRAERLCDASGLGITDSEPARRDARAGAQEERRSAVRPIGDAHGASGATGDGLADTDGGQQQGRADEQGLVADGQNAGRSKERRISEQHGSVCGMVDPDSAGSQSRDETTEAAGHGRPAKPDGCGDRPGPTNGEWQLADWLYCRDGKWRPVEPGTFPLVDGAPARVGRLRGYGNAIVAPLAQAFIEAAMGVGSDI